MKLLTKRQKEILAFLHEQVEEQGVPPSTREIQSHFGFASQTAALNHLRALQRKGFIERKPNKARAMRMTSASASAVISNLIRIPFLGQIAAGLPSHTEQAEGETVQITKEMLAGAHSEDLFALRVTGSSMIDAHIVEGDVVVLERRTPRAGEIVAALVDGESTLKRFIVEEGEPLLKAENALYPNIKPVGDLSVQGVMVALLRQMQPGLN